MKIDVLDHGYVEFIEAWGTGQGGRKHGLDRPVDVSKPNEPFMRKDDFEAGIIEAARQSTQGSFRGWNEDEKLLATLFNHQWNQSTPFEAAGMTIEVQAPIMVFREWHRHRTQSYNEASARYKALPDLYYLPDAAQTWDRVQRAAESSNKQEASTVTLDLNELAGNTGDWLFKLNNFYQQAEAFYQSALEMGIPKELARLSMPVGHYSRMRATANLRNWLAFLTLRMDSKAQWEIRQYANAVYQILYQYFPRTCQLFVDRGLHSG